MSASLPRGVAALVLALLAALLLVAAPAAVAPAAAAAAPEGTVDGVAVERFGGGGRIETAVEVSRAVFPDGAQTVTIARADAYADALVGAVAAAASGGPILLSAVDELSPQVGAELERLGAERVILLGGTDALDATVESTLAADYAVTRVMGANRFDTAAQLARLAPSPSTIFIAEGGSTDDTRGFPDPLAVASYAAFLGSPVLLAAGDALPTETRDAITELAPAEIVIVGGPDAVPTSIEEALAAEDPERIVRRLAGGDRYETSAAVYDEAISLVPDPGTRWLATGLDFPDALAAGPSVAASGNTLLVVDGDDIRDSGPVVQRIRSARGVLAQLNLLGETDAIGDDALAQLTEIIDPDLAAAAFCLTVLHFNDGESQLVDAGEGLEPFGGVARFASVLDREREAALAGTDDGCAERGVLSVSSGDNLLAGPEFTASLEKGVPFYDSIALDAMELDALALGNHEFDFGPDTTADFIDGFETSTQTRPLFVSANLDFEAETQLARLEDDGVLGDATLVEVADGVTAGVIGLTTPDLAAVSSPRGVVADPDLAGITQAQVDAVTAAGADLVVVISHLQDIDQESELVTQVRGVDVVVGGGGGELLTSGGELLVPGDAPNIAGSYPTFVADAGSTPVPIVTTSGDYRYLGALKARFDAGFDLLVDDAVDPLVSRAVRVGDAALPAGVAPDAEIQAEVVDPVAAFRAALDADVIGTTEVDLDGVRESVRAEETNLGDLAADSIVDAAQERAAEFGIATDDEFVGFVNGGGIRNNTVIAAGSDLSVGTTFDISPFGNFVSVTTDVTPEELKTILENGYAEIGGGAFAQVSGFEVVVDTAATAQESDADGAVTTPGERVREVTLEDGTPIVADGEPVTGAPNVSLVAPDFLARGGDGYPFPDREFTTVGLSDQQALEELIADDLGGVVSAAEYPVGGEGRITLR